MFHTLFHPGGTGTLSSWVAGTVWRISQRIARLRPSALDLAGPAAMVTVILLWTALQAVGWGLVYWRFLPTEFRFASGMPEWAQRRFVDSLYASLVAVATLGFGDITPTTSWLRILAPLEALIGFAVLTAGLSWVLSVYPVLHRRSSFAQTVIIAARAHGAHGSWLSPEFAETLVERLTGLRSDLRTFPVTFYFRGGDSKSAFPVALALVSAQLKSAPGGGPYTSLHIALSDLTQHISERFLSGSEATDAVIQRVLDQHGWTKNAEELLESPAEDTADACEPAGRKPDA